MLEIDAVFVYMTAFVLSANIGSFSGRDRAKEFRQFFLHVLAQCNQSLKNRTDNIIYCIVNMVIIL